MATFPPKLTGLIRRQHGVISAEQLESHGESRSQLRTLRSVRLSTSIHQSVYIVATAEHTVEARAVAACLANPTFVISGPTAGRLTVCRNMPGDDVHVMTTGGVARLRGVEVHRTNLLDYENDVVRRPDGIRLLAAARRVFDIARFVDDNSFESVLEHVLDRHVTTVPELFAAGAHPAEVGTGRLGAVRQGGGSQKIPWFTSTVGTRRDASESKSTTSRGTAVGSRLSTTSGAIAKRHVSGGSCRALPMKISTSAGSRP